MAVCFIYLPPPVWKMCYYLKSHSKNDIVWQTEVSLSISLVFAWIMVVWDSVPQSSEGENLHRQNQNYFSEFFLTVILVSIFSIQLVNFKLAYVKMVWWRNVVAVHVHKYWAVAALSEIFPFKTDLKLNPDCSLKWNQNTPGTSTGRSVDGGAGGEWVS